MSPSVSKGFYIGSEDIKASGRFIIYPGNEAFKLTKTVNAISLAGIMDVVKNSESAGKSILL